MKTPTPHNKNTEKIAWYGVLFMVILMVLISLFSGCATTHETPKKCCESKKTSVE